MITNLKNFTKLLPEFITSNVEGAGGHAIRWEFPNGYGASVVCHPMSYSGAAEFAVLREGRICYDTPITSDVISHVTEHEVAGYLARLRGM